MLGQSFEVGGGNGCAEVVDEAKMDGFNGDCQEPLQLVFDARHVPALQFTETGHDEAACFDVIETR